MVTSRLQVLPKKPIASKRGRVDADVPYDGITGVVAKARLAAHVAPGVAELGWGTRICFISIRSGSKRLFDGFLRNFLVVSEFVRSQVGHLFNPFSGYEPLPDVYTLPAGAPFSSTHGLRNDAGANLGASLPGTDADLGAGATADCMRVSCALDAAALAEIDRFGDFVLRHLGFGAFQERRFLSAAAKDVALAKPGPAFPAGPCAAQWTSEQWTAHAPTSMQLVIALPFVISPKLRNVEMGRLLVDAALSLGAFSDGRSFPQFIEIILATIAALLVARTCVSYESHMHVMKQRRFLTDHGGDVKMEAVLSYLSEQPKSGRPKPAGWLACDHVVHRLCQFAMGAFLAVALTEHDTKRASQTGRATGLPAAASLTLEFMSTVPLPKGIAASCRIIPIEVGEPPAVPATTIKQYDFDDFDDVDDDDDETGAQAFYHAQPLTQEEVRAERLRRAMETLGKTGGGRSNKPAPDAAAAGGAGGGAASAVVTGEEVRCVHVPRLCCVGVCGTRTVVTTRYANGLHCVAVHNIARPDAPVLQLDVPGEVFAVGLLREHSDLYGPCAAVLVAVQGGVHVHYIPAPPANSSARVAKAALRTVVLRAFGGTIDAVGTSSCGALVVASCSNAKVFVWDMLDDGVTGQGAGGNSGKGAGGKGAGVDSGKGAGGTGAGGKGACGRIAERDARAEMVLPAVPPTAAGKTGTRGVLSVREVRVLPQLNGVLVVADHRCSARDAGEDMTQALWIALPLVPMTETPVWCCPTAPAPCLAGPGRLVTPKTTCQRDQQTTGMRDLSFCTANSRGTRVVTGTFSGVVSVWRTRDGALVHVIKKGGGSITSLATADNHVLVATASGFDGRETVLAMYDLDGGALLWERALARRASAVFLAPSMLDFRYCRNV